jgi:hypothetical protein
MIDVENFIKIKLVKWIESIINSNPETWNILPKYWLEIGKDQ